MLHWVWWESRLQEWSRVSLFRDFPDCTFQAGSVEKMKEIKQHLEFGCIPPEARSSVQTLLFRVVCASEP